MRAVQLACASWYGFDQRDLCPGGLDRQPLDAISDLVFDMGFNCVRLPVSLEAVLEDGAVSAHAVRATSRLLPHLLLKATWASTRPPMLSLSRLPPGLPTSFPLVPLALCIRCLSAITSCHHSLFDCPIFLVKVSANPPLAGLSAVEVMDAVVESLGRRGLMVVLDEHTGKADWYSPGKHRAPPPCEERIAVAESQGSSNA